MSNLFVFTTLDEFEVEVLDEKLNIAVFNYYAILNFALSHCFDFIVLPLLGSGVVTLWLMC